MPETNGYYVQQRPWTPTKRRGPIAAEFVTPGPAAFNLPTTFANFAKALFHTWPFMATNALHKFSDALKELKNLISHSKGPKSSDATKSKSPAFTFGVKYEEKQEDNTPGPGEYSVDGVTKSGKDWSPAAFFSERFKDPEPFPTPAPGSYNPEKSIYSVKEQSPSFTFGAKIKDPKPDETPSPSQYNTDKGVNQISTHQQPPSFTMGMKHESASTENLPGPGDYNVPEPCTYKVKRQPAYTLSSRTSLPGDKTTKPSPSEYKTEKVWINKSSPPRFTFGVRHSNYISTY